jgi:hypothetical protein
LAVRARPCIARTRLLRLSNWQNEALRAPPHLALAASLILPAAEEVEAREGEVAEAVARIRLYLEKAKKVRVHLMSIIFKQFTVIVRYGNF